MTTEEPPLPLSTPSPLDKPLHLLTEDDISQVTREQCRQYLKQKGMRRPSWNKSQAIQQVIMLKALLEPASDSDDCSRKLHITHRRQETIITRVQKGTSTDTEVSVSADEAVPEIGQSDLPGDNDFVPHWMTGLIDEIKGQMPIFYRGMVNVYDNIPAEKLAASPLHFSQEAQVDRNVTTSSFKCRLHIPNINSRTDSSAVLLPTLQTAESSASRKASVQRYLENGKIGIIQLSLQQAVSPTVCLLPFVVFLMFLLG